MNVLFDLTHPAFVHLFKNVIRLLQDRGHAVLAAAREKEMTVDLLEALKIPYQCLSRKRSGLLGMAKELIERDIRMVKLARQFRPDVLVGGSAVSLGTIGCLLRLPVLILDEMDAAWLQRAIGLPFASHVLTGTGYQKNLGRRQVRFRGVWVQSYLDPRYFKPDPAPLVNAGIDPEESYVILRLVSWGAVHDVGLKGSSQEEVIRAVQRLKDYGRVFISMEAGLPAALADLSCPVPVHRVHDLMAYADLYIGEGVTMAAEAAVLGVPSIVCNPLCPGYLQALIDRYGLVHSVNSLEDGLLIAEEMLTRDTIREEQQQKRQRLLAESDDIVEFMYEWIEKEARV